MSLHIFNTSREGRGEIPFKITVSLIFKFNAANHKSLRLFFFQFRNCQTEKNIEPFILVLAKFIAWICARFNPTLQTRKILQHCLADRNFSWDQEDLGLGSEANPFLNYSFWKSPDEKPTSLPRKHKPSSLSNPRQELQALFGNYSPLEGDRAPSQHQQTLWAPGKFNTCNCKDLLPWKTAALSVNSQTRELNQLRSSDPTLHTRKPCSRGKIKGQVGFGAGLLYNNVLFTLILQILQYILGYYANLQKTRHE